MSQNSAKNGPGATQKLWANRVLATTITSAVVGNSIGTLRS